MHISIEELINGQAYSISNRQGMGEKSIKVKLIHDSNISELKYRLGKARIFDRNGERVRLSDVSYKIKSPGDIRELVNVYNDSWDNCW